MELISSIIVFVSNACRLIARFCCGVRLSGKVSLCRYAHTHCVIIDGQFMQIYNEKLYDLLLDKSRSNPLQIRETSTTDGASEMNGVTAGGTSVHVKGLTQHKVLNKDDVFQMLKKGIRNRAIRSTDYNHESSRSHSIFQIIVVIEEPDEAGLMYTRRSTMSLVDLAGSEKWITNANAAANASSINNGPGGAGIGGLDSGVNTPNASMQLPTGGFNSLFNQQSSNSLNNSNIPSSGNTNGALDSGANNGELTDAQKELTHINTSLHILGLCVSALIEPGRKHIPYRDSVLTRYLNLCSNSYIIHNSVATVTCLYIDCCRILCLGTVGPYSSGPFMSLHFIGRRLIPLCNLLRGLQKLKLFSLPASPSRNRLCLWIWLRNKSTF